MKKFRFRQISDREGMWVQVKFTLKSMLFPFKILQFMIMFFYQHYFQN